MKKPILPLLLLIHLAILFSLQFTAWPEMYSYPYLVNNGFTLYHDIIYPYPPLLVIILSKIYLYFGYSIWNLKIFTWILLLLNDLLIFSITNKLTKNKLASYLGLVLYIFAQSILEGNMMWFDVALVTPLLSALYLAISFKQSKSKYFRQSYLMAIGFMLSLAALTKQTTAIFLITFSVYYLYKKINLKEFIYFLFPTVFMGSLFILKLASESRLSEALNWMLIYPLKYWSNIPGYVEFSLDKSDIYIMLFLIIPSIFALYKFKSKKLKEIKFLLISSLTISLLIIYPRFSFFHFQLGIALCAILISLLKPKYIFAIIVIFALTVFIPKYRILGNSSTRFIGETEKNLSLDINNRVAPQDSVYLFNIHSGVYHLANRLPPKPWFDNFAWYLEIPGIQQQILARWKSDPPDFIYFQSPEPGAWYELGTYLPKDIVIWMQQNYEFIDNYGSNVQIYKYKPASSDFPGFAKLKK